MKQHHFPIDFTMSDKQYPPVKQSTAQTEAEQVRYTGNTECLY